jgi:hypothetical protein
MTTEMLESSAHNNKALSKKYWENELFQHKLFDLFINIPNEHFEIKNRILYLLDRIERHYPHMKTSKKMHLYTWGFLSYAIQSSNRMPFASGTIQTSVLMSLFTELEVLKTLKEFMTCKKFWICMKEGLNYNVSSYFQKVTEKELFEVTGITNLLINMLYTSGETSECRDEVRKLLKEIDRDFFQPPLLVYFSANGYLFNSSRKQQIRHKEKILHQELRVSFFSILNSSEDPIDVKIVYMPGKELQEEKTCNWNLMPSLKSLHLY